MKKTLDLPGVHFKYLSRTLTANKGNHDRDDVWKSDLNKHRFLRFYFHVFSLLLVLIDKIYQTLKTMSDHISKLNTSKFVKTTLLRVVLQLSSRCLEIWSSALFFVWYINYNSLVLHNILHFLPRFLYCLVLFCIRGWTNCDTRNLLWEPGCYAVRRDRGGYDERSSAILHRLE